MTSSAGWPTSRSSTPKPSATCPSTTICSSASSTAAMANGACSADRGTKGGGGWYCASVKLQIRPRRESAVSSNSSPLHAGLRQKKEAFGKNTVPHVVHRLPSSAGSSPVVNQPSIAGVRGRPVVVSDTASDYSRPVLERVG